MGEKYPDTVDGVVLQNLANSGSDMSRPMLIDFAVSCPDEASAMKALEQIRSKGFVARASKDEANKTATWSIYIPVEMTPNHDEIVFFQNVLDDELQKFGAKSDGWGTFGNKDN